MPRSKRGGNCYEVHAKALLLGQEVGTLCHGQVFNPKTGRFHGHAWIEAKDCSGLVWCKDISNGNDRALPKQVYYRLGRVRRVARYATNEIKPKVCEAERWGPWPKAPKK